MRQSRQSVRRHSQSPPPRPTPPSDRERGRGARDADLARSASQQQRLNHMVTTYLENVFVSKDTYELEARFGTRGIKPITRRDYENVIEKIRSAGYAPTRINNYHLRIQCSGGGGGGIAGAGDERGRSDIRVEVNGLANIQEYCRTNVLNRGHTIFNKKDDVWIGAGDAGSRVQPILFDEFNFKVSLQKERRLRYESSDVAAIAPNSKWDKLKKTFRYLNRTSFEIPGMPIRIDLSVVKESHREPGSWRMIPEYNFTNAKVTESPLKYEIEIEILNDRVGPGKYVSSSPALAHILRGAIKLVLSGLQGTNFPVPYPEIQSVCNEYHRLLHSKDRPNATGDDRDLDRDRDRDRDWDRDMDRDWEQEHDVELKPWNFIGPSSVTLQMPHIADGDIAQYGEHSLPNIRYNYTVTEKADGIRKMLFVNRVGRMYLIDMAMNVQFTGAVCIDDQLHNTLLDGEHIMHNRAGEFINLYAAFDIYYTHKIDIRHLAFVISHEDAEPTNMRIYHLQQFMRNSSATFRSVVSPDAQSPIRLVAKRFEVADPGVPNDIFRCCRAILDRVRNGAFEYGTDGLVFTPANTGVGVSRVGLYGPMSKTTWTRSLKWKPVEHNTIDFLITTEKNRDQHDIEKHMLTAAADEPVARYKTLTLRVGYSVKNDGYLNPMSTVLDLTGDAKSDAAAGLDTPATIVENDRDYVAAPFYPTMPPDSTAHICNLQLHMTASGEYQMQTESGEPFSDRSVVEFRYDREREAGWRWIPIKVRHDKTLMKDLGNAFRVANDNWFSIHNPVTEDMMCTGERISVSIIDADAYYDRAPVVRDGARLRDTSTMQPLRDFHNLFVKRSLISAVCKPGDTLIDLAVGKAGDLAKWAHSELSFVFGIDISEDNIGNRHDGAYARYLTLRKSKPMPSLPYVVFVQGDSGKVIRASGSDAAVSSASVAESGRGGHGSSSAYKSIANAVFGEGGDADPAVVGRGVMRHYAAGKDGFNTCSVQFALHYFWKDVKTLHTFLRNVSECTKVGGHFIGTCYNGERVYKTLTFDQVAVGEALTERDGDGRLVWSLTRQYTQTTYLNDESSIGYAIDVFQESINKTHREYLVNMVYLARLMESYGFVLVSKEDAKRDYHLPNSMGSFRELFEMMNQEIAASPELGGTKGKYKLGPGMNGLYHTPISFMHNYFIFRKREQVNAKRVAEAFIKNEGVHEAVQAHLTADTEAVLPKKVKSTPKETLPAEAAKPKTPVKPKAKAKSVELEPISSSEPKKQKPKTDKPSGE